MRNIIRGNLRQDQGSVLILVLIVVSSLASVSLGLAYCTRIELRLSQAHAKRTQVYYLALGGIERIKALFDTEQLLPSTLARLSLFSDTAENENVFEKFKSYDAAQTQTLAYGLRDEQGYLNLNESDPASWQNLEVISQTCLASILDWTDTDDSPSSAGAENDYYRRLEPPYSAKNGILISLKELLFVKGITRDMYIGQATIQGFLADKAARGYHVKVPFDNSDDSSNLGLIDVFGVYGDGTLNINTTSRTILSAMPGLDEELAETIEAHRAGPDSLWGTDDDRYFTNPEDFTNVERLSELHIELLQQYCGFSSEYFRAFSYAHLDATFQCYLMATIRCAENATQLVCIERLL